MENKETNPKDAAAVAQGRLQFSVIPWRAVPRMPASPAEWMVYTEVALAMAEGAWKYGRHNYRVAGVRASVYFDAAMRHLVALEFGEEIDPDSGVHHHAKAIAGLLVLRDAIIGGMWTDDRPPAGERGLPDDAYSFGTGFGLRAWWDGGYSHEALDDTIKVLVAARAEHYQGPPAGVYEWRTLVKDGVRALRERMGTLPHTPPYTALEVAATRHDTEPPPPAYELFRDHGCVQCGREVPINSNGECKDCNFEPACDACARKTPDLYGGLCANCDDGD